VSCVPFGFLPVVLFDFARLVAPRVSTRRLVLGAGAGVLALVILVLPAFTATRYADYSLQTFGVPTADDLSGRAAPVKGAPQLPQ